jgi:hypothetical protein
MFEPIGGFGWNLCGGDNIEGDLDAISSNPVASTIPTWRTFKLLKWVQILKRVVDLDEIMYVGDDIKKNSSPYVLTPYLQPFQNGGRLNIWGWSILKGSDDGVMHFDESCFRTLSSDWD